jgi:hypothetical protein
MATAAANDPGMMCLYYNPDCADPSKGCDLATSCMAFGTQEQVRVKTFGDPTSGAQRLCMINTSDSGVPGVPGRLELLGSTPDAVAMCSLEAGGFAAPLEGMICPLGSIPVMMDQGENAGKIMCMASYARVAANGTAAANGNGNGNGNGTAAPATTQAMNGNGNGNGTAAPATTPARNGTAAPATPAMNGNANGTPAMNGNANGTAAPATPAVNGNGNGMAAPAAPAMNGNGNGMAAPAAPAMNGNGMAAPAAPAMNGNGMAATAAPAAPAQRFMTLAEMQAEREEMRAALVAEAREEATRRMQELEAEAVRRLEQERAALANMGMGGSAPATVGQVLGRKPAMRVDMPDRSMVRYPPYGMATDSAEERLRLTQFALGTVATSGVL